MIRPYNAAEDEPGVWALWRQTLGSDWPLCRDIFHHKIVGSAAYHFGDHFVATDDAANVYYDHPQAAPLDHTLNIDFVNQKEGSPVRVAVELSADSARLLVDKILAALKAGELEHAL